jgi:hypothetical protein
MRRWLAPIALRAAPAPQPTATARPFVATIALAVFRSSENLMLVLLELSFKGSLSASNQWQELIKIVHTWLPVY